MKLSAIVAVIGAFAVVIFTNHSEGDPLAALLNVEAAVIVLGGSFMAVLGQFHIAGVIRAVKGLKWLIQPPAMDVPAFIEQIAEMAAKGRQNGLLALEEDLPNINDPLFRFGLQLVIDGTDLESLRSQLHTRMDVAATDHLVPAEVWEAVGGFAPTLGVLGAVMGLIHVMLHLSGSGSGNSIGTGIAAAFVATLYGVGSANLIFIPAGKRLQRVAEGYEREQEMIVTGLVLLAEGANRQAVRARLSSFAGGSAGVPEPGREESREAQEVADAEG